MLKRKSARWHTIYSIVSTVIEGAAIAAVILWVLPLFGMIIPLWGLIVALVVYAVFSYIMYRIGHPTILYEAVSSPESIIGSEGIVDCTFNPEGYVRVHGELWKAFSFDKNLAKGEEIIVTGIDGLKLNVVRKIRGLTQSL